MIKKILNYLLLLSLFCVGTNSVNALKYEEAINQSKPIAILLYAPWADGAQGTFQAFKTLESRFPEYNFVTINIATEEARAYNQKFSIYPNLPYVILFRERGKISRLLKKDCVVDSACFSERLKMFNP